MAWGRDELPEWVAEFIGGPYDGAEVVVIAVCDFVAVKRVRQHGRPKLSVIGNPDPTPPGYELYRLDGFDEDSATYVYAGLDFDPSDDRAGAARDLEYA